MFRSLLYPNGMVSGNRDPQIDGVGSKDRAEALDLVFSHLPPVERWRQTDEASTQASPPDSGLLDGLMGAWRAGRLVGAIFSQRASGKTAIVQLPRLVAGESETTISQLYSATWDFLARQHVILAQALLSSVNRTERMTLRLGGFHHLADLFYLVSQTDRPNPSHDCPIEFESYDVGHHERWVSVLRATHQGSLDCLGLGDMWNPGEVLLGYRSMSVFDPRLWLMAWHEGRAVGCLLLADHPRHDNLELLYLGLIPEVRGRGWGKVLARVAQQLASHAGRRRLVLAVDTANTPALQTYMAVGFQTWQHRRLYIKRLFHRPLARIV